MQWMPLVLMSRTMLRHTPPWIPAMVVTGLESRACFRIIMGSISVPGYCVMCLRCGVWRFWHAWIAASVPITPQHFLRYQHTPAQRFNPTTLQTWYNKAVMQAHDKVWQGNDGRRQILKRLRPSFCEPCWPHGQALWRHFGLISNRTFWFDYCLSTVYQLVVNCWFGL